MPFRINDLPQELCVMVLRYVSEGQHSNWIKHMIRTDKFEVTVCLGAKYGSPFSLSYQRALRLLQWIGINSHSLADLHHVQRLETRPPHRSPTTSLFIGNSQDAHRCYIRVLHQLSVMPQRACLDSPGKDVKLDLKEALRPCLGFFNRFDYNLLNRSRQRALHMTIGLDRNVFVQTNDPDISLCGFELFGVKFDKLIVQIVAAGHE
jgi:hypothetical protein